MKPKDPTAKVVVGIGVAVIGGVVLARLFARRERSQVPERFSPAPPRPSHLPPTVVEPEVPTVARRR